MLALVILLNTHSYTQELSMQIKTSAFFWEKVVVGNILVEYTPSQEQAIDSLSQTFLPRLFVAIDLRTKLGVLGRP